MLADIFFRKMAQDKVFRIRCKPSHDKDHILVNTYGSYGRLFIHYNHGLSGSIWLAWRILARCTKLAKCSDRVTWGT